jgi:hypothetical protein
VQNDFQNTDVCIFLREMAARALFRSKNCFDLSAAHELRLLATDLEKKATSLDGPGLHSYVTKLGKGQSPD